jgi:hypothetical protein
MRGTVSGTTQVMETEKMTEDWVLGGLLVGILGAHSQSEARPCLLLNVMNIIMVTRDRLY